MTKKKTNRTMTTTNNVQTSWRDVPASDFVVIEWDRLYLIDTLYTNEWGKRRVCIIVVMTFVYPWQILEVQKYLLRKFLWFFVLTSFYFVPRRLKEAIAVEITDFVFIVSTTARSTLIAKECSNFQCLFIACVCHFTSSNRSPFGVWYEKQMTNK